MIHKFISQAIRVPLILGMGLIGYTGVSSADDTEIYQSTFDSLTVGRPKVLIVFDDSGSMGFPPVDDNGNVVPQRPGYSSTETYVEHSDIDNGRIYWSKIDPATGEAVPPPTDTDQWFRKNKNRCASSYTGLDNAGFFQSAGLLRWKRNVGKWKSVIKNNGDIVNNARHFECKEDVLNSNPSNGSGGPGNGYAKNVNVSGNEGFDAATPSESNVSWGSDSYTFYSAHYMNYWNDNSILQILSKMTIAQNVISSLISANTGIDFGLIEFNGGWSNPTANGGRVIQRIIENMTAAQRTNVVSMVNSLEAGGSTPLCEASYEAYRYLSGSNLKWGADRDTTRAHWDAQPRDTAAESPAGKYDSPATDCAYTYVIIMTDGFPQNDQSANSIIETLTGKTCSNYPSVDAGGTTKNCLPELAEYMATTDLDSDTTNGNQFGITYTIGFNTNQQLLVDTATKGGGKSYVANSADELTTAFSGAILSILSTDSTFTSPAVAVDTFTRTRSRNDVFYAMFKPTDRLDWPGNVKKLKLSITSGNAVLVDGAGAPAIDASTGNFKDSASTFWSSSDGGNVLKGGVGALLAARDLSGRTIYSNTGTAGALEAFNSGNMTRDAFGFSTDSELFAFFGVTSQTELDAEIASGRGFEINLDGSISTESREWILADILHSKPLVINYGATTGFTKANPDLRFIVGTNGGFLHMFGNDNGEEDWAFFPKELAPLLGQRRLNPVTTEHAYGIDMPPIVYTRDVNHDGTINYGSGDKVWAYFGLRRGGRAMYALDLSNPNTPSYLWGINSNTSGFSEMGQTWSIPAVTRIPGYRDANGVPKPVIVFGAGYDTNKDSTGLASADSMGRGIFIVDAATGALVWSVTPGPNTATNLQETGLQHGVPGQVTVLDSNSDELTDRIYFADTGGHIWRVDLSDNTLPTASQNTWKIVKLADLNGGALATDRRFFNAPDVVRIRSNNAPVDVVMIGSGDRTNPNATDVDNRFYLIEDHRIIPYVTAVPTSSDCSATPPIDDFRCLLPITDSGLFDITSNILATGTDAEKAVALAARVAAKGWRLDLTHDGEKSLSKSLTINGRVFFTTFTPDSGLNNVNVCEPQAGLGLLYVLNIYDGNRSVINLGPILPDTPSVHFGDDGKIRLLLPPGSPPVADGDPGDECDGGVCDLDEVFRAPYGTYWFQEEY